MAKAKKIDSVAREFLEKSLARVESKSIREWAESKRNHRIWLEIAQNAVNHGKMPNNPDDLSIFAAYVVAKAMG